MTPLYKKLGLKSGDRIRVSGCPSPYFEFFNGWPNDVQLIDDPVEPVRFIHIFATTENELMTALAEAKPLLKKDGILWVSWPKKTSSIPSDINKFDVLRAGQNIGLVDVKVAAINKDWSGHKFVYRLSDRN